jgi:hypothetical protein
MYATVRYCTLLYATVRYCTLLHVRYRTQLQGQVITVRYASIVNVNLSEAIVRYCTLLYATVRYRTLRYATVRYCKVATVPSVKKGVRN